MVNRVLYILFFVLFFLSCKKNQQNNYTLKSVHGEVKNNCNDSLLNGIEVNLGVYKESKQIEKLVAVTNQYGKFEFKNVKFFKNSEYKYKIAIDGYSNQDYEFSGLDKQEVAKNLFDQEWKIGVTYTFDYMHIELPTGVSLNENDSLRLKFLQKTIHKNQPWKLWEVYAGSSGSGGFGGYWMGPWNVTVQKWKNGVYSEVQDSIYMGKGEVKEYIIPW